FGLRGRDNTGFGANPTTVCNCAIWNPCAAQPSDLLRPVEGALRWPIFGSVPAFRRARFDRCLTMTRIATSRPTTTNGQTPSGCEPVGQGESAKPRIATGSTLAP